ncbi:LIN9 family protein [Megaselia abdita]
MSDLEETPEKKTRRKISNDDDSGDPPSLNPASLGLHPVGKALPTRKRNAHQQNQPVQPLNARGMPARIRKPNKHFFDDNIINDPKDIRLSQSPRKSLRSGTTLSPARTPTRSQAPTQKPQKTTPKQIKVEKKEIKKSPPVKKPPPKPSPSTSKTRSKKYESSEEEDSESDEPVKPVVKQCISKETAQSIGLRLRNLLKLPKAHKWVLFEWFYSFIDKPLFDGENDFQLCLKENYPQLKTRNLTRFEWNCIRRRMGRPRRCSSAFFEEERRELERKRQNIRLLQLNKFQNHLIAKDLPEKIPYPLPVGTKVNARIKKPANGLFVGTVDAYDSISATYRVSFDRKDLGTQSIPDFELSSIDFHEMISLNSVPSQSFRSTKPVNHSPIRNSSFLNKSDPLLAQDTIDSPFLNPINERETIGGFPIKLLETLVRLKKTLSIKKSKLSRLSEMNSDTEKQKVFSESLTEDFQRKYATVIVTLEKMNRDLQNYVGQIQTFAPHLSRDPQVQAMLMPTFLREKCREEADDAVERNNQQINPDDPVLGLIKDMATVLLVSSRLGSVNENGQVIKVLEGCIEEAKMNLYNQDNVEIFQKQVEIHLHHIRLDISQLAAASASASARQKENGTAE